MQAHIETETHVHRKTQTHTRTHRHTDTHTHARACLRAFFCGGMLSAEHVELLPALVGELYLVDYVRPLFIGGGALRRPRTRQRPKEDRKKSRVTHRVSGCDTMDFPGLGGRTPQISRP
jgi:hypothetical protein